MSIRREIQEIYSSKKIEVQEIQVDRPDFGTIGRKIIVKANHFLVDLADRDLNHYDVSITPEVTSKKVCRHIMCRLAETFHVSHLGKRMMAFDGGKNVFTAGKLPFVAKDFVVKLTDTGAREREFKVSVKFVSKVDHNRLQRFLQGEELDRPQKLLQCLDVVLRENLFNRYKAVGRSFFSPLFVNGGDLGGGLEYWKGFYQSIRPTQMGISINIDMSARAFVKPVLVSEFAAKYLRIDLNRTFSKQDRIKVKEALKGVKVELSHLQHIKQYNFTDLSTESTNRLMFSIDKSGTQISVEQYFCQKYNIKLEFPNLPAVKVGSGARPVYFPMEICRIAKGQLYSEKLKEGQVTALLKATCQRPQDREKNIMEMVHCNNYNSDILVNEEFGMHVTPEFTEIEARVLPPPKVIYDDPCTIEPKFGRWNMINKKMYSGGRVFYWACISFSECINMDMFCDKLISTCRNNGMEFNPTPVIPHRFARPDQIKEALFDLHSKCSSTLQGKDLQLLIILLPDQPDQTDSYSKIKLICDTELGIVSQCCQPRKASKYSTQYMENVSLKINVKVGGLNCLVQARPSLARQVPTIIFGADVTHPHPGDDSSPSIAAVVASMNWPNFTMYRALVSTQAHREEIIHDLYKEAEDPRMAGCQSGMIRDHILAFYKSNRRRPSRIIFYRDGVSEGQFNQVLLFELRAIKEACFSLHADYFPLVTFVVVQKRHHTRLFPANYEDRTSRNKTGNILPGTVVDTKICHPTKFDFYLCSHAGTQGTSRPAHYHVLYDENGFTANAMQALTYDLCYMNVRCTRSVSIVTPAYYAHLAARRARHYLEGTDTSDSGSTAGGGVTREKNVEIRPLPLIKDNVKEVMFYC